MWMVREIRSFDETFCHDFTHAEFRSTQAVRGF
jgi:hypothetical protein